MRLGLLRRCRRRTCRSPVLETFPAIDRAPLRGLKRNRRFFGALRADCLGFYSLRRAGGRTAARCTVCFACFAPLGLVFETLVGEKHLLARCKNKLGRTFGALQDPIVVFHTLLPSTLLEYGSGTGSRQTKWKAPYQMALLRSRLTRTCLSGPRQIGHLVLLTPLLFSETLTREGLFRTTPFTWFHVIAVLFDLLDNVLRLHFPFKTPERIFQRFTLLNDNFCHAYSPPIPR
jgi:hypothetical protein